MSNQMNIDITDSEWEVMRVIWSQGKTTSSEIVSILEAKMDWKPTTIKTLIARLVKKALVGTEREGNRFIYRSLVSESDSWKSASQSLFGHICSRKIGKKIASLIEENPLSYEDITLIQAALTSKKKEAVEEVICNCIPGQCNCNDGCC